MFAKFAQGRYQERQGRDDRIHVRDGCAKAAGNRGPGEMYADPQVTHRLPISYP